MKKYVLLYAATTAAIIAIFSTGQSIKGSILHVAAVEVEPGTAEDIVTCTGKVEAFNGNGVYAPDAGIVKKLYVKTGDKVTVGQRLMDIQPVSSGSSSSSLPSDPQIPSSVYESYAAYLNQAVSSASSGVTESSGGTSSGSKAASYTLNATSPGIIESLGVSAEGGYVSTSAPAAVIRSQDSLQVRLSVDEAQVADLKEGQKVQISGVGFKNSVYSGSVESISGEAKQVISTTGQETVVEVIASVKNPGADIKPGFTAKAKIITSQNDHLIIVPYEAVRQDSKDNEFVYCAVNGKAKKVPIVTGREFDSGFEVKNGLQTNNVVITDPDAVSEGSKVVPVYSAAGESHG